MNGHRIVLGLCMLCALLVSAFAAQSASAVIKGTTAFTCEEAGPGGGFTKAHCKSADAGEGSFSHVAIGQDTTTEVKVSAEKTNPETNACTNSTFKTTIAGVATELTTCDVHGEGWMENKKDPSGEHYLVSHVTLTFTNVKNSLPECEVWTHTEEPAPEEMGEKEVIHTQPLKLTTTSQGDSVKIEPTEGTVIARYWLTNCKTGGLNGTYTVSGSLTCKADGATVNCSHAEVTTQATLRQNTVVKSGFNGLATVSGRAKGAEGCNEVFTPLSATTVET